MTHLTDCLHHQLSKMNFMKHLIQALPCSRSAFMLSVIGAPQWSHCSKREVEPVVCVYLALNRPRAMISVKCFICDSIYRIWLNCSENQNSISFYSDVYFQCISPINLCNCSMYFPSSKFTGQVLNVLGEMVKMER